MTALSETPDPARLEQSRYAVASRLEIVALLNALARCGELVSVPFCGGTEVALTSVLAVDEAGDSVLLDAAANESVNRRLLAAEGLTFETALERVRVTFAADRIEACLHRGRPALRIPLPHSVVRLQRREFYRVVTPLGAPVRAHLPLGSQGGGPLALLMLYDISLGGVALKDDKRQIETSAGRAYEGCRIELPGIGRVEVGLQVRNAQEVVLATGIKRRRVGCCFIDLAPAMQAAVQRYTMKLERDRNALVSGRR